MEIFNYQITFFSRKQFFGNGFGFYEKITSDLGSIPKNWPKQKSSFFSGTPYNILYIHNTIFAKKIFFS